jgi:hypothetical protein
MELRIHRQTNAMSTPDSACVLLMWSDSEVFLMGIVRCVGYRSDDNLSKNPPYAICRDVQKNRRQKSKWFWEIVQNVQQQGFPRGHPP